MAAPMSVSRISRSVGRWTVLFDGDEVVGVGDKVGVVPLLRRLLHDGRRARWGRKGLAFALLRRKGAGWG
eukprot:scaffold11640_cov96-Isochrysis_galbana.AAC.1